MKKIKIFDFVSAVFRIFLIFMIFFVWANYFFDKLMLSLIISTVSTICVDFTIKFIDEKRKQKLITSRRQQDLVDGYINAFVFNEDSYALNFFFELASSRHNVIKRTKYIIISHPNSSIVLFPFFTFRPFNTDDLIFVNNYVKNLKPSKLIICTNKIDPSSEKLCQKLNKNIIILNGEQTYEKLLKEYDFYPTNSINLATKEVITWKDFFTYALNKKRTKGYFFSSLILLFSSFIVSYNLYYVIVSSLLLILALVSFLNPKFNQQKIEQKLLY